jgi:RNA 2',3'-cyclic 3'-phosphodiesterase
MPPFKRLFIGLELPDSCKVTLAELNPKLRGLRWIGPEQQHLTLSFLGALGPEKEGVLHENLSRVRVPPFFLPLSGVGFFRSRGRPSVVWVGVGNGHPHLFALHRHIQDAVLKAGLEPDLKPFHPHVTVGRARDISTAAVQPFIRKHSDHEFGMLEVKEFVLFSSHLAPEGATYFPELRVPLE